MKSVLHQGTTVTILLPKLKYEIKGKEQVQLDSTKSALPKLSDCVFILDDLKNNRELVIEIFKEKELDFIEADNGQEGLAYIEKNTI